MRSPAKTAHLNLLGVFGMAASVPTHLSMLYAFVRSRQLEGTYPGDPATGHWGTTAMRVSYGWGAVSEEEWPYSAGQQQWPPSEPPGLDEKAKLNRIRRYQRIHDSLECKYALAYWGPVQASFEITAQWLNAKNGIIELPEEGTPVVGSHAVCLTGYSDQEGMFEFINSWGENWGDSGYGKLPYEYFDRWMLDVYISDPRHSKYPKRVSAPIADIQWSVHDFAERLFHVHELYDQETDERLAWAFAMPGEEFLNVEELFVRPQYRGRGYGTHLLKSLHDLSRMAQLHLRLFIPFADCRQENLKTVERLLTKGGYFLTASGVRWAPYTALRKAESVRIPPPPGLIRQRGGDTLAAPAPPLLETSAGNMSQSVEVGGSGRTNNESVFRRLTPAGNSQGDNSSSPCVIVLSDWSQRPYQELRDRIADIFREPDERAGLPTVLIVDDLASLDADHEAMLSDLATAGGIPLVPDSQEEIETIRRDPLAFAATQIAIAMQAHPSGSTAPSPSGPSLPDAYKEFAKAVTRLSPQALQDVIEGRRTDDWRYSS